MEWKHKKESKWLIVENRKVHCYLCGRKILKASQRIYDAESGHYSHAICEKERQLTGTNERRSAVKKIVAGAGVLGLTAVGVDKFTNFGRMSNSVFSSNAKDQTVSPDLETVITSQGIILPSLTSDPANPVAGQMWYRSDAGVTAHYDSIQNRVVYSSEINNGNVNVTSKGIINGLSVLPNDGTGGFGPDTTLDASSVGEIGSPYTQTNGMQEAINYGISLSPDSYHNPGVTIQLLRGDFYLNTDLYVYVPGGNVNGVSLKGAGRNVTFIIINAKNMKGVIPYTETETFSGEGITFQDLAIYLSPSLSPNTVYSLIDLDNFTSSKLNFINCKFNTSGNSGFSNTNTLMHGGIYQSSSGITSRLSFIGCTLNGANVYNDSSNNEVTFMACDFNQGLNVNVTAIYRAAYYFANMSFIACNITAHIQLQGKRSMMMLVSGGNLGGEIYISGGYHFIYINSIWWSYLTNDTAYVSISSGATLSSLILENIYFPSSALNMVDNSGTINYFKFTSANASSSTLPIINVAISPSISANPPVSGTVYQNTNPYAIEIDLPVYATTSGTAGYVTIAKGATSTPTAIGNQYVSGDTSSTATQIIRLSVPAGWYYSFTGSGVTFATATPFAE